MHRGEVSPGSPIFEEIAPFYDAANLLLSLGQTTIWRTLALKDLDLLPGDRVLDVGCGTGWVVRHLRRTYPGIRIEGMDISPAMLHQARLRDPTGHYFEGNLQAIPRGDRCYDLVTAVFILRNLPDLRQPVKEMLRVLKPQGRLLVLEAFPLGETPAWFRILHRGWLRLVIPFIGWIFGHREPYCYLGQSILHYLTLTEFLHRLTALGTAVEDCRTFSLGAAARVIARAAPPGPMD
jgi:demethylmenaquinone methyltransferase/2-methoxy-6-polyprenyl-1,4-benzoquinol methylase